ncbi:MAG: carbohydrate kinase [Lewinellaceae bacterium]|nr:carbohydrate kinase [Lewinellaceae bacterium]
MYLIGYDIGSSSIKAALIDGERQKVLAQSQYPDQEMDMISRQSGWAEQQPEVWWQDFCMATRRLLDKVAVDSAEIKGIGIAYQMHGLVLIGKDQQVLRPAIIWCDSRAVSIGEQAFQEIGTEYCLKNLLNSPGNFTASKLRWIKDNEPEVYAQIHKILLPGDYIAMKLTGKVATTISGLTEGIFWNFNKKAIASELIDYYQLDGHLFADIVPTFSVQGWVTRKAAEQTGLAIDTPITYRAGDQPNNALSLNVLHPGEIAATSGTSGVVYGIVDHPVYDKKSRINAFGHVNYEENFNRIGILLCLNGAGIQYSWIKHQVARGSHTYQDMERMVSSVPVGSEGLCILPFGNGAERMLGNRTLNGHIFNLQFNRHTRAHLYRAALEGVAFSFVYGINILKKMGLNVDVIRVGNDNMFQSKTFSTTMATKLGNHIEVVETNGAIGAAKAAGVASGIYRSLKEALSDIRPAIVYEPQYNKGLCDQAYSLWLSCLERSLNQETGADLLKKKNYSLERELKNKSRKIASTALQAEVNNDFLHELKSTLNDVADSDDLTEIKRSLKALSRKVESFLDRSGDWQTFEEHFDLLHSDFFKRLKDSFPGLSVPELKICAYLKMGLSTKEIAERMNMSVRGMETRRYRMSKKFGISPQNSLSAFIERF